MTGKRNAPRNDEFLVIARRPSQITVIARRSSQITVIARRPSQITVIARRPQADVAISRSLRYRPQADVAISRSLRYGWESASRRLGDCFGAARLAMTEKRTAPRNDEFFVIARRPQADVAISGSLRYGLESASRWLGDCFGAARLAMTEK
jgi:hypothetical protein